MAILTSKPAQKLLNYPKDCLTHLGIASAWPVMVAAGKGMLANFPASHRAEMESGIKAAGIDRDLFVVANTMFDIQKVFGCSTLIIEPDEESQRQSALRPQPRLPHARLSARILAS